MRVLFVNLLLLGDVVNTAHVAASFKKFKKGATVDLLTYESNKGVSELCVPFSENHYLNRDKLMFDLSSTDQSILKKFYIADVLFSLLSEVEYDLVVNLTHNNISSIICSLIKSKKYLGVYLEDNKNISIRTENNWFRYFNDFVTRDMFNSFQYIDVFKMAMGVPCVHSEIDVIRKPDFLVHDFKNDKYFIIKPTTSEINKDWGEEKYIELAGNLTKFMGCKCFVVGVEKEKDLLEKICEGVGEDAKVGIFSFTQLASIIDGCEFIVGGDTGILHLAAAMHKKVVTISLGPGTYSKSTPYGSGNIILYPKEECYPCSHLAPCEIERRCRYNIEVEDVFSAIVNNKVENTKCGALVTGRDTDGFLTYSNINSVSEDDSLEKILFAREKVKKYLGEKTLQDEYDFLRLNKIVNAQQERSPAEL